LSTVSSTTAPSLLSLPCRVWLNWQLKSLTHSPTNQLNLFTSLSITAHLGWGPHYIADPTEYTPFFIVTVLLCAPCFRRNMFTKPQRSNACSFLRSLHSSGTTCYNMFTSSHQNAGKYNDVKVANRFFENQAEFKC
jgi:hypothetical protein